ncbi:T-complex protein 1 subunit gamma [Hibiscus syriacus]|uniref:T-complex protein 1 subunit gamma n=1 Tax=Hibiscus syriacus TaxID=106335 RepID=A0A6A2YN65_HIBSY|nr:T-complex protein 1 subunit gamma [Hibiscus syriacus]
MKRKIANPRVILLDCPLEYKKGENQTNAELDREEDWEVLLKMEEEYIENLCLQILKFKPDLVITEKGLGDLSCHYLSKAGVSAIRRVRKTDNIRIAKASGAVIVNLPDELQESDVVLLRGASKDLLDEVERNLQWPYEATALAFEAMPHGNTGAIADMKERKIWDAYNVKAQTFKTAIEAACMLLRIDDIVGGIEKKHAPGSGQAQKPKVETEADADADGEQILPD